MTKEKFGKILFRFTVLLMCLHAIGLICVYGLNVSLTPEVVSYDTKDGKKITFEAHYVVSRWFDLLLWPIGALVLYLLAWPLHQWFSGTLDGISNIFPGIVFFCVFGIGVEFPLVISVFLALYFGVIYGFVIGSLLFVLGPMIISMMSLSQFAAPICLIALIVFLVQTMYQVASKLFPSVRNAWKYMIGEEEKKEGEL